MAPLICLAPLLASFTTPTALGVRSPTALGARSPTALGVRSPTALGGPRSHRVTQPPCLLLPTGARAILGASAVTSATVALFTTKQRRKLAADADDLREKLASEMQGADELRNAQLTLQQRVGTLTDSLSASEAEVKRLTGARGEEQRRLKSTAADLERVKKYLDIEKKARAKERTAAEQDGALRRTAEKALAESTRELEARTTEVEALQSRLDKAEDACVILEATLDEISKAELQTKLTKAEAALAQVTSELDFSAKDVAESRAAAEKLSLEVSEAKGKLEAFEGAAEEAAEASRQQAKAEAAAELSTLRLEASELEKRLKEAEMVVAATSAAKERLGEVQRVLKERAANIQEKLRESEASWARFDGEVHTERAQLREGFKAFEALDAAQKRLRHDTMRLAELHDKISHLATSEPAGPLAWFEEFQRGKQLEDLRGSLMLAAKAAGEGYSNLPALLAATAEDEAALEAAVRSFDAQVEKRQKEHTLALEYSREELTEGRAEVRALEEASEAIAAVL